MNKLQIQTDVPKYFLFSSNVFKLLKFIVLKPEGYICIKSILPAYINLKIKLQFKKTS